MVPAQLWADPRIVYPVAIAAVALLLATLWFFRHRQRNGRQAAVICLSASIVLHIALIFLVPLLPQHAGGRSSQNDASDVIGVDAIAFSAFDPEMQFADGSGNSEESSIAPLPIADLNDLLSEPSSTLDEPPTESTETEPASIESMPPVIPASLASSDDAMSDATPSEFESDLSEWLQPSIDDTQADRELATTTSSASAVTPMPEAVEPQHVTDEPIESSPTAGVRTATVDAPAAAVVGDLEADFANRVGSAKQRALFETGGGVETEAAVAKALRFLVAGQRADGSWDPRASGAGQERSPLGMSRDHAGSRAETAITGLAVLSLVGAGNTHQSGEYAENVYRGLAYLIGQQQPDGSLAGGASVYESTYSHGMAALAMCEAAAMTGDQSAIECARRAVAYTTRMQHSSTGGWRYLAGDPGDLSQLGWQAMVIDGGHRAGIAIDRRSVAGIERFLASVRAGQNGGLASYRPGEAPSRTMTAEALATRLLIGSHVSPSAIEEAQRSLTQQLPGVGQDNYYYWYYATLALHQLQDDAWRTWNDALKRRLLGTQRSDGSWPTDSVWGGYGGSVYTTSMATLCLESYYRHALRNGQQHRIAERDDMNR